MRATPGIAIGLFLACLLAGGIVRAAEVEGVRLPEKVRLAEGGPELHLNGAGLRTRAFFRVYVGALYLPQKTRSAQAAIAETGPKRVALHMLRDLTAEQFFSALNDGLRNNHAPDELAKIEPQVTELQSIFNALKAAKNGDAILIDYIPAAGTRITVNGEARGTIAGDALHRALLRVWLGDQPADLSLKRAMLGG